MSVATIPHWTASQFFDWAFRQEGKYEFDGTNPVAMNGGSGNHDAICHNIYAALRARLRGTPCSYHGPSLAIRTVGEAIRYPDALITCTKFPGTDPIVPDPVIVFEVLSPDSGRRDRIVKVREYAAVATIRRYAIVESSGVGVFVLHRADSDAAFTAATLTDEDVLNLPEVGIAFPVAEIYEGVEFGEAGTAE